MRTRHGVYATKEAVKEAAKGPREAHALRVKSAVAVVGDDAVACCSSAAAMLGLDMLKNPPADVVTLLRPAARKRNRMSSDGVAFRAAAVVPPGAKEKDHVTESYGVRLTTVLRTVVDLARELPFMDGVVVADSAFRKYGFWKADYMRVLKSCVGWPGLGQARETIEFADGKSESVLESALRVRLREWGFPPPELQVELPAGPNYVRVDFLYRDQRTVIEADGMAKMDERGANKKQYRRDQWLRDAGYRVVHVDWRDVFYDQEVAMSRIRTAITAVETGRG